MNSGVPASLPWPTHRFLPGPPQQRKNTLNNPPTPTPSPAALTGKQSLALTASAHHLVELSGALGRSEVDPHLLRCRGDATAFSASAPRGCRDPAPNRRSPTGSLQIAQLRIPLAGGSLPDTAWPKTVLSTAGGGDSADPRAPGPAVGGRWRRPVERQVPGEPGSAPGGQSGPPPAPPSPWGSSLRPGGGAPLGARTQRANRVRPRLGAVPRSPRSSESAEADSCARYVLACRGSQAVIPKPLGAWLGALGPAAQVRWPRARKQDSPGRRLRRRAPRR
ncbi:uncharacterized protein LOC144580915 [Callithrix jacchus]